MGFYDALTKDNYEIVEKTSKRNMWAWEFNRYSRLLFDLDKLRFLVFSGGYEYLPQYFSMLNTLLMSLRSMISKDLFDELEGMIEDFNNTYPKGIKVLNDIGNDNNVHFVKCRSLVRRIDFKLEEARQACGMKLPVDNKLSATSKAKKALLSGLKVNKTSKLKKSDLL